MVCALLLCIHDIWVDSPLGTVKTKSDSGHPPKPLDLWGQAEDNLVIYRLIQENCWSLGETTILLIAFLTVSEGITGV